MGIKELELEIRNVKMRMLTATGVIKPIELTNALIELQASLIKLLAEKVNAKTVVNTDEIRKAA